MRALKIIGIAAAALLALLVLGAAIVLAVVNPNDYRGDIERLAQQKTGRRLQIGGQLDLRLFPWLALSVADVRLGNPPGFGSEPFLTVRRASLGVKLLPLLAKRLEVSRISVDGLTVNLINRGRQDEDNNWNDLVQPKTTGSASSAGASGPALTSLGGVDVTKSTLVYRDEAGKSLTTLANLDLRLGSVEPGAPLQFELRADAVDLARPLTRANTPAGRPAPPDSSTNSPAAPKPSMQLPIDVLRKLNANGTVHIGRLTVAGVPLTRVTLPLAARDGRIHLGPASAEVFGGTDDGDIVLDARPAQARLSLNEHIKNVEVAALLKALYDTSRISGRGDADAVLTGMGNTDAALVHSLTGKLDVNVKGGALEGIDLAYELRRARALLRRETVPARTAAERTPFDTLTASGTLEKEVLRNNDLRIETEYLKARGKGTLDLSSKAVDYELVAEIPRGRQGAGKELADAKATAVPLSITGTLADLKVRPDIQALAQAKVRQEVNDKVQEKAGELKQRLSEKLNELLGR